MLSEEVRFECSFITFSFFFVCVCVCVCTTEGGGSLLPPPLCQTDKVRAAIHRLKQEAGVIIRSQSPVMRGINDDGEIWAAKWREEVRLGVIPYYMFMARDTGAQAFFDVPLVRASMVSPAAFSTLVSPSSILLTYGSTSAYVASGMRRR